MEAFEIWLKIVHGFTKLSIINQLDITPAISGMASYLSEQLKSSYTAGIWTYNMGHGLLWRKLPYQESRRVTGTQDYYIPTWSWASLELLSSKSFGLHVFREDLVVDGNFRATTHGSVPSEIRSFVGINDARLQVRDLVITCSLIHQHDVKAKMYPTHLLGFQGGTEYMYTDISCQSDRFAAEKGPVEVKCLLVGATSDRRVMT